MRMGRRLAEVGAAALLVGTMAQVAGAMSGSISAIGDASLNATFTTIGGAAALATTKAMAHLWTSTRDPFSSPRREGRDPSRR
jgi:hypothetical protein